MWLVFKYVTGGLFWLTIFIIGYVVLNPIAEGLATDEWTLETDKEKYVRIKKILTILLTCFTIFFTCLYVFNFYKNYINLPKVEYNNKSELVLKSEFSLIEAKDDSLYIEKLKLWGYSSKIIDTNQIVSMECNSNNPKKYGTTLQIKYRTDYKVKNNSNDKDFRINDDDSASIKEIEVRIRNYEQYRLIAKRIGYR